MRNTTNAFDSSSRSLARVKSAGPRDHGSALKSPRKNMNSDFEARNMAQFYKPKISKSNLLDTYLEKCLKLSFNLAVEETFIEQMNLKAAYFWGGINSMQVLYSQTLNRLTDIDRGLVGASFCNRRLIRLDKLGESMFYDPEVNKECRAHDSVLVFPLYDFNNSMVGILELIALKGHAFTEEHEKVAIWFTNKYKLLSQMKPCFHSTSGIEKELLQILPIRQYLQEIRLKIINYFDCRDFSIWKLERNPDKIYYYTEMKMEVEIGKAGIAGDSLFNNSLINCSSNKMHCAYNINIDGDFEEAILAIPFIDFNTKDIYSFVLRGPRNSAIFTTRNEDDLSKLIPTITIGLNNCEQFQRLSDKNIDLQKKSNNLEALLDVVEIIPSHLDITELTNQIMEKGRQLTNSDRCSLFLVNEKRDKLITSLQLGLDKQIEMPINKGIVGKTATEGTILNIEDAYLSDYFDRSVDLESGYMTRQILSVPIFNIKGQIIGVTEMVNTIDKAKFDEDDEKTIRIFNVFCGVAIENAKLFKQSNAMSSQLRSFFNTAFSLSNYENIYSILESILNNARSSINAENATLFIVDDDLGVLHSYIVVGGSMPPTISMKTGIVGACVESKHSYVVNDVYADIRFDRTFDIRSGFKTRSIMCVPMVCSNGNLMGVVELVNKKEGDFNDKDLEIVESLSIFATVALQNSKLKDIAQCDETDVEINNLITEEEKMQIGIIPTKLIPSDNLKNIIFNIGYDVTLFSEIEHLQGIIYIFNQFNFLTSFQITNEKFLRFLLRIRATYNQVPYHNWHHACDVLQYVTYQIHIAKLDQIFDSLELFTLMISAICHDANHGGFNNIYNVKAGTPLGILFKDKSVMEIHHITVSIRILEQNSSNIFENLDHEQMRKVWNLMILLILATDMSQHFNMIKKLNDLIDANDFDLSVEENRELSLQLIMKTADISNVSRPFELANKWVDILNEEFFRQGDQEKALGIGLTSQLNDREHSDKPKSQIGFYNFVCLPLYMAVARLFPMLDVNLQNVEKNLSIWRKMQDEHIDS